MQQLPDELNRKILNQLTPFQMVAASLTCKSLNQLRLYHTVIPLGLEGLYNVFERPTLKERRSLHRLVGDSYYNIYELFEIAPFVSYCKDMSCEIDKILGCGGGNRYFRPSFCNIQNAHGFLSNRYIKFDRLNPDITLRRRVRICNDNFLYGYLF
jgi:hypothetical protein